MSGMVGSCCSTMRVVALGMVLLSLQVTEGVPGVPEIGGTFRYGHIYYTSTGNEVHFRIEAVFKRNIPQVTYWKGSFSDNLAQVGDELTLLGRETPNLYLGDGTVQPALRMRVIAFSVEEDWVMGEFAIKHTYATPNNGTPNNGRKPWLVEFSGCCRLSVLTNNKDAEWVVTAAVDLTVSRESPRARILPVVSVPDLVSQSPQLYVPVDYHSASEVGYKIVEPWAVGTSIRFTGTANSFLSVPLNQINDEAQSCSFNSETNNNNNDCLYELLRAKIPDTVTDVHRMTIEGWVKVNTDLGGPVLSVGQDIGNRAGINYPALHPDCVAAFVSLESENKCQTSSLYIKVSKTHITVGHEKTEEGTQGDLDTTPHEVSFDVCTSPVTLQDPNLCQNGVGVLTGKWVHITVVRNILKDSTDNWASYKVYLMGEVLETVNFKVRPTSSNGVPHSFELGESDLLPSPNPGGENTFMEGAAITFGGYRGKQGNQWFDGWLDEWRFWHGERTQSGIFQFMNQPIRAAKEQFYGDPSTERPIRAGTDDYNYNSILLASYTFDVTCPATDPQCAAVTLSPEYPKSEAAKNKLVAYVGDTTSVKAAPTDSTGIMFYSDGGGMSISSSGLLTLTDPQVGMHQVSVQVSFGDGTIFVPVDFLVDVLPISSCQSLYDGCQLQCEEDPCEFAGNQLIPSLNVYAPVLDTGTGVDSVFVGSDLAASIDVGSYLYPGTMRIFSGFEVNVTLEGLDDQTTSQGTDSVYTNVGFSSGTVPTHMRFTNVRGTNPSMMDLLWTPCNQDVGSQTICFDAVDRHISATPGTPSPRSASSIQKCIKFTISEDPTPMFLTGTGQTPTTMLELTMGQHAQVTLMAVEENCLDKVDIGFDAATQVPAGAILGEQVSEVVVGQSCPASRRQLQWTPSYNHGGFDRSLCFTAHDSGGNCPGGERHVANHCIRMVVHRCRFALLVDQQLQEIAERFGTTWMNLWSLNAELQHPDYIVYGGSDQTIMIGHDYQALEGESPAGIAKRMGMHIDHLTFLNFGMDPMATLSTGQELCVIPNSCEGMGVSAYDQNLADPSFFRESSGSDTGGAQA